MPNRLTPDRLAPALASCFIIFLMAASGCSTPQPSATSAIKMHWSISDSNKVEVLLSNRSQEAWLIGMSDPGTFWAEVVNVDDQVFDIVHGLSSGRKYYSVLRASPRVGGRSWDCVLCLPGRVLGTMPSATPRRLDLTVIAIPFSSLSKFRSKGDWDNLAAGCVHIFSAVSRDVAGDSSDGAMGGATGTDR